MKKTLIAAALAAFVLTSCSETKKETAETENHAAHTETEPAATAGQPVVETPDYTSVAAPVKTQLTAMLDNYLKLKDGLIASDAQAAQSEAKLLVAAAEKVDVTGLAGEQKQFAEEKLGEVKQSASKIAASTNIDAQRENLELLSEATFALTKAFGATDQKLYYQHCPMALNDKGAYWLSSNEEIRNPYFGDKMLKCGSNEEIYN